MEIILTAVLTALGVGALAGGIVYLRNTLTGRATKASAEAAAQQIRRAEDRSKEILLEAKEQALTVRTAMESDLRAERQELQRQEKRAEQRDEDLTNRATFVEKHEAELGQQQSGLDERQEELKALHLQELDRLESISGLSLTEARESLLERAEEDIQFEIARRYRDVEVEAQQQADESARAIVSQAIQRLASDVVSESTVGTIPLPNDEMKGRLIGREGRNIRSFETMTGVDVIVDDTPEAVILSGYDPVRREVARMALERLVSDGRIHPTRIEEVVEKAKKEMEMMVREAGEQACFELGIHGMHSDVVNLMGQLNYRTSYGQNVLQHSKEVSMLCGLMASALGLDDDIAKRCGLLHDLGKAIDRETEGTHTQIGMEFLKKYNEHEYVINAVGSHHGDIPQTSPYAVMVQAADAISGSRPGARREPLEGYIKRLEKLEELADSFKGVAKAYAIQAGREIRVIVENDELDDLGSSVLASDIAKRIEKEMEYPGQIKVTVIREMRSIEYAR